MHVKDMNEKQLNMYLNLTRQSNAIFKHINKCAFKTRERYEVSMRSFCAFLVLYKKQNIRKISNKHIEAYVKYMQDKGMSTSTVTTNLSGIRFFYDHVTKGKFMIKTNAQLGVIPRSMDERIGEDRSITASEYEHLLCEAYKKSQELGLIVEVGKVFGLRIHEAVSLRRSQLKKAFRKNDKEEFLLKVKGKGGLIRYIPIGIEGEELLKRIANLKYNGTDRIFLNKYERTHIRIKYIQGIIADVRNEADYTFHSLRHSYAQEQYKELLKNNSDYEARLLVAQRLGHNREEVSRIYLDSSK